MRHRLVLPCLLLLLSAGVAQAQRLYIPPGQEAKVQAMLSPVAFHQPLGEGWLLTGIAIEGATVGLTFTGPAEQTAQVVLHHPSNGTAGEPAGPLVVTGEAPAPVMEALQSALAAKSASALPWRPAQAQVPPSSRSLAAHADSSPFGPVPWQRWLPFLLLAVSLGWLAIRYRAHATRWALIALPAVTLVGLLVRVAFSPRTMLHEYYHAGDHLLGYLFPQAGQRFFYGDTGPTLYTLANAVMGGDEQAVFTTNLLLSVLTIPVLAVFDYVLFRDWKRATFTASLFALLPLNVRFAASEDLSNPAVLLGTLALILGVVFVQRGGFVAAVGAALATSLTMQTRPELMLWPLAVLVVALAASKAGQWIRLLSIPAAVAALVLLTALPQALHLVSLPGSERLHGGIFQKPGLIAFFDPKAVPPLLVLMAIGGLAWALRHRRWLGVALLLVAAGGAHVSLTFFLNPPPYNLRTQMITLPTLLVLCGCVVPLLRERLAKIPSLARVAPAAVLVAMALWSASSTAWVKQLGDSQQEFDFLVRTVPKLPTGPGALLTVVGGHESGGRVGMFPMHLLSRAGSELVPRALPDPTNPSAHWPPADGSTVFYQGMYCYSSFKDEPPAMPLTPRCARVHEHYVLEPIVTEEIAGPGYSPMEYAPPPYRIGFYRAVSLRQAPSAAVPPAP